MKLYSPIIGLVLNFRDSTRTANCVRSLLKQGIDSVLVWDNSEDDSVSAKELTAIFMDTPNVHIKVSPVNLGFSAGVNRGLSWITTLSPHAWVLLINNDAKLLPDGLALLSNALKKNPQASIAHPNIDNNGYITGSQYYHRLSGLLTSQLIKGSFRYASGCCMLLATDRIRQPVFDEDFFMYGEDWAIGANAAPEIFVHVAKTLAIHEGTASSGLGTPFYESRIVAAHFQLARKVARSKLDLYALLFSRILFLTLRSFLRTVRFKTKTPLIGLWEGWKISTGKDALKKQAHSITITKNK